MHVVATITNPNAYPVTISGVDLPLNTSYAGGFTTSALSTAQAGCTAANSDVIWNYSTGTSGSVHTFTTPLTVAANGSLTVTFTNDASMTAAAPAACAATFFSMSSLTGVVATGGAATATTSPATDAWTRNPEPSACLIPLRQAEAVTRWPSLPRRGRDGHDESPQPEASSHAATL